MDAVGGGFQLPSPLNRLLFCTSLDVLHPVEIVLPAGDLGAFGGVAKVVTKVCRRAIAVECESFVGNDKENDPARTQHSQPGVDGADWILTMLEEMACDDEILRTGLNFEELLAVVDDIDVRELVRRDLWIVVTQLGGGEAIDVRHGDGGSDRKRRVQCADLQPAAANEPMGESSSSEAKGCRMDGVAETAHSITSQSSARISLGDGSSAVGDGAGTVDGPQQPLGEGCVALCGWPLQSLRFPAITESAAECRENSFVQACEKDWFNCRVTTKLCDVRVHDRSSLHDAVLAQLHGPRISADRTPQSLGSAGTSCQAIIPIPTAHPNSENPTPDAAEREPEKANKVFLSCSSTEVAGWARIARARVRSLVLPITPHDPHAEQQPDHDADNASETANERVNTRKKESPNTELLTVEHAMNPTGQD